MVEIIPNWHPIFVHFTVALFSTAVGFYLLAYLMARTARFKTTLVIQFEITARWCLWSAALITIGTVLAGFYAYNTVNHDEASHLAMINHRNWAIPTAIAMILMAAWSLWRYRREKKLHFSFILILLIVQGLLLSTAWRGAELIFRYGLGVQSLPQPEGAGHHHPEVEKSSLPTSSSINLTSPKSSLKSHHTHEDSEEHSSSDSKPPLGH